MKKFTALILLSALLITLISACSVRRRQKNFNTDFYEVRSTERIFLHEEPSLPLTEKGLELISAKHEDETAFFSVFPEKRSYTDMKLTLTEMVSENGDIYPAENVSLFRVLHSKTEEGNDAVQNLLLPLSYEDKNKVTPIAYENTMYAVNFSTPADTKEGTYRGEAVLTYKEGEKRIPISLEVMNFTLPPQPSLHSMFLIWSPHASINYFDENISEEKQNELLSKMYEVLIDDYKLSPAYMFYEPTLGQFPIYLGDTDFPKRLAEYRKKHPHITTFQHYLWCEHNKMVAPDGEVFTGYYFNEDNPRMTKYNLMALDALIENGLEDITVISMEDEPTTYPQYQKINAVNDFLKGHVYEGTVEKYKGKTYDEIFTHLNTSNPRLAIKNASNTWCPIVGINYVPDREEKARLEAGSDYWWYFCSNPPGPSYDKFCEPICARIQGVMAREWDVEGILFWRVNHSQGMGASVEEAINETIYFAGPGDGVLDRYDILGSTRAVSMRDSIEDYDYMLLFEKAVQKELDALKLDMTLKEAMEGFYRCLYTGIQDYPVLSAKDNYLNFRKTVARGITDGVDFLFKQEVYGTKGDYQTKKLDFYVAPEATVKLDGTLLTPDKTTATYSHYTAFHKAETADSFVTLSVNGKETRLQTPPTVFNESLATEFIDITSKEAQEAILKANSRNEAKITFTEEEDVPVMVIENLTEKDKIVFPKQAVKVSDLRPFDSIKVSAELSKGEDFANLNYYVRNSRDTKALDTLDCLRLNAVRQVTFDIKSLLVNRNIIGFNITHSSKKPITVKLYGINLMKEAPQDYYKEAFVKAYRD